MTSNLDSIKDCDEEIYHLVKWENARQEKGIELIASENYASAAVMQAQGSVLTNKYAEGYPGKRYYGGCQHIDRVEELAIKRAQQLFQCQFANVQPHSGSQANMAAYFSLLKEGDKILGMDLSQGGHLTHGSPVNFSGRFFKVVSYGIDQQSETLDYQEIAKIARREQPQLIIAGASAYPREIDFKEFAHIAEAVGAYLVADMAHIAGLIAVGLHPTPLPHAHLVTSTTHKTLRGPRGGLILTNHPELAKKINFNIFPGIQGGPLEHVIAAKAVTFKEALQPDFKTYQKQVLKNARRLAEALIGEGLELVSGGTDNHLLLVKTNAVNLTGKEAEDILQKAHITCNKNMIPGDQRSPMVTSGIRLGTPAVTSRGFKEKEIDNLAKWITIVLKNPQNESLITQVGREVANLCEEFPIYK